MNYIYLSFVNLISSRFKDEDLELFDLDLEVEPLPDVLWIRSMAVRSGEHEPPVASLILLLLGERGLKFSLVYEG